MDTPVENRIDVQKTYDLICVNPSCKSEGLKFLSGQDINKHKQCEGWVIKIDEMQSFLVSSSQRDASSKNKNIYNFKHEPLKSLFSISRIFTSTKIPSNDNCQEKNWVPTQQKDPIQLLKFNFNRIRIQIENELEKIYYQVESRLLKVKDVQLKTTNEIKRILTTFEENSAVSEEISKSKVLKSFQEFCEIAAQFTLIEEEKIKKQIYKIFQSIQSIGNSFWKTELESIKQQKQLFQKAYSEIQKLLSDESVHPAKKFQNLQNMFQEKNQEIYYSSDKSQVWMKCWICRNQLFGQGKSIKDRKGNVYANMVEHVTRSHFKQTTARFALQMIKSSTHRLSYGDFLQQLEEKRYKQFIIVDRENMSKSMLLSIEEKINQENFIIDVVSKQNEHLAIGKYLVSMSQGKDSADILMVMVIYAIITSGYYRYVSSFGEMRKPKITLMSKDHFAETYQGIIKGEFGVEITIIK